MTEPLDILGAATKMMDLTTIIGQAVVGYRAKLKEGGFADAIADTMAKEFHDVLMRQIESKAVSSSVKVGPWRPAKGR